jgi:TusA-related sulfurtransferase
LANFADITRAIESADHAGDIVADRSIELGSCGMGMPVLRSQWALDEMPVGEVLEARSGHPWSYPDIHAWVSRAQRIELVGEKIEGETITFYLRKLVP